MTKWVYINGDFVAEQQATVSVFDRGFLFADAVYEVIPAYQGQLFQPRQHIQRLWRSLSEIGIEFDDDYQQWLNYFQGILDKNGGGTQGVYLQVSRAGQCGQRSHSFNDLSQFSLVGFTLSLPSADKQPKATPYKVITAADIRWHRCDIKTTSLLANLLMLNQAQQQGADDAIIVRNGNVVEATSSNVFVVLEGQVYTPSLSEDLLAGVTREFVIGLLHQQSVPVLEQPIDAQLLNQADEIWLTSSTKEIQPVSHVDSKPVGAEFPGQLWRKVSCDYFEFKQRLYFDPKHLDQLQSAP